MRIKILIVLIPLLYTVSAYSCYVTPDRVKAPPKEVNSWSSRIALAKVTKISPEGEFVTEAITSGPYKRRKRISTTRYTFETLEVLKGKVPKNFTMDGLAILKKKGASAGDRTFNSERETFNNHDDKTFWSPTGGRLFHMPDCIVHPSFENGKTYLIFLDEPHRFKSFEKIESPKDKWLEYVRKHVSRKNE